MADSDDANVASTSGREVPDGYKVLTEGKGCILQKGNDVFYNPAQASVELPLKQHCSHHGIKTHVSILQIQVVNRDISIAVLRYFVKQRQLESENGTATRSRNRVKGGVTANPATEEDKVLMHTRLPLCA